MKIRAIGLTSRWLFFELYALAVNTLPITF